VPSVYVSVYLESLSNDIANLDLWWVYFPKILF